MCDKVIFDKIKEARTKVYLEAVEKAPFCSNKNELCEKLGIKRHALDTIEKDYGYPSVTINSKTFGRKEQLQVSGRSKKISAAEKIYFDLSNKQNNGESVTKQMIEAITKDTETVNWLIKKLNANAERLGKLQLKSLQGIKKKPTKKQKNTEEINAGILINPNEVCEDYLRNLDN